MVNKQIINTMIMRTNYLFDSDAPLRTRKQENWTMVSTTQQSFIRLHRQRT